MHDQHNSAYWEELACWNHTYIGMEKPTEVRLKNSGHRDHYDMTLPIAYYFDQDHTRLLAL